jgi:glutamyl-tRNA synthetase
MRQQQARNKKPPKYDGHCRNLKEEEIQRLEASGLKPVIRLKIPQEGETSFNDIIHGHITFKNEVLDDLVLLKSDGYPTYHLANVIDDHDMSISHVLRADEWISSTPRHVLLYSAFGWETPQFAHLPMLLGPDKSKLSKRHGATTLNAYKEEGYLPETMINYLALLGWSLDDKTEIFSKKELIKHFSLERVSKTPAVFNKKKLEWMNGYYIRNLTYEKFTELILPLLDNNLPEQVERPLNSSFIKQIVPLLQERTKTLPDVVQLADFFFLKELTYDPTLLLSDNIEKTKAIGVLQQTMETLQLEDSNWDEDMLDRILRPLPVNFELSNRQYFGLIRSATTGKTATPPLFPTMAILGKATCLHRLSVAIDKLTH